ncbi:MAG: 2,3-epoxybenzoyl-CoA dihydrolase [Magnetovibrio sp.]|nr:2,3-epoxybenzoyl-CoA dihydrolase [Magnetovibrio sp.]
MTTKDLVVYDRDPASYRHWTLTVDGGVATLTLGVDEDGGLRPGYKLKLNSYDLGVDMELYDALQRLRFEHPGVGAVIVTSALDRMFSAGANIYMLGQSSHGWKVNFCKFTNETRNGIEDTSRHSGVTYIAALNGTTAGGGYELALACDEIWLVDDRSSAVSLPEVPLLGVLPGTGGLTRVVDKRRVRRDLADVFCTSEEGVRGRRAKEWGLVDETAPPQQFMDRVRARAADLAAARPAPPAAEGVAVTPLARRADADGYHYTFVDAAVDRAARTATLTVRAPTEPVPADAGAIRAQGMDFWPLAMARELDDAILMLRTNEAEAGVIVLRTEGDAALVLAADAALAANAGDWFVREVIGMLRRTLARLDVSSRSLFALIDEGSCFAGTLYELALAADRSYMLDLPEEEGRPTAIALSDMNFGPLETISGSSRLALRFAGDAEKLAELARHAGEPFTALDAEAAGLVTFAPDDIDWDDEIRIAIEERAALSPDALTGLEANLRFAGAETMLTKVFGRLSAWQNWIFNRPNAVGEEGALKRFGSGSKPDFDWKRV